MDVLKSFKKRYKIAAKDIKSTHIHWGENKITVETTKGTYTAIPTPQGVKKGSWNKEK